MHMTKFRLIPLAAACAVLVSCATARLSHEVKAYVGRDIHELTARLGNPTGKRETNEERVYVWSVSSEGVLPTGSANGVAESHLMTVAHECTLEVTLNAQSVIQSYAVDGSDAGCAAFRRHLER
jgi:hypothetical protein